MQKHGPSLRNCVYTCALQACEPVPCMRVRPVPLHAGKTLPGANGRMLKDASILGVRTTSESRAVLI